MHRAIAAWRMTNASKIETEPVAITRGGFRKRGGELDMTSSDANQTSTLPRDQTLILARLVTDASRAFDRDPDTARELVHRASELLEAEVRRLTRDQQTGKLAPWQVRTATTSSTRTATATCRSATWPRRCA
jgi:hypothetical protein